MFYSLCGIMNVLSYTLRGLGKSFTAMIIAIFTATIFRIIWLNVMYKLTGNFTLIYTAFPVSWMLSIVAYACVLIPYIKKVKGEIGGNND